MPTSAWAWETFGHAHVGGPPWAWHAAARLNGMGTFFRSPLLGVQELNRTFTLAAELCSAGAAANDVLRRPACGA
jgi:hypothetical protein